MIPHLVEGRKLTKVWAFVRIDADGTESLLIMHDEELGRYFPAVTSMIEVANKLSEQMQQEADETQHVIELRTFVAMGGASGNVVERWEPK